MYTLSAKGIRELHTRCLPVLDVYPLGLSVFFYDRMPLFRQIIIVASLRFSHSVESKFTPSGSDFLNN